MYSCTDRCQESEDHEIVARVRKTATETQSVCQMVKSGMTAQVIGYEHSCNKGCGIKWVQSSLEIFSAGRKPSLTTLTTQSNAGRLASNPLVY